MNMGDFLKQVTDKAGPQQASSMANVAKEVALIEILISKGIFTREEFAAELEKQLDKFFKIATNPDVLEDF